VQGSHHLVVGGAGFVGANLVRELLSSDAERIVIVDNFLSSEPWNVPTTSTVELVEGSIADDRVLDQLADEFDFVFHLATYHGNQSSIADPIADHNNNLVTTLKLFERLARFARVRKVVYAASGCTLAPHTDGEAVATPEEGSVPFDLDSPYQISKVVGELYAVYFHRRHGLPAVRARFQNVYGPGEILGAGRWRGTPATVWRNVVPTFVYRAIKQLPLELENGGQASRDFIYVGDVVRGLIACAERGTDGDVYNLASGHETSIDELADAVKRVTGSPAPVTIVGNRTWDRSGRRFGSPEKARRELGFTANVALDEGLRRTIAWTTENLDRIDRCIASHADELESYRHRLEEPAAIRP
jgi:UDP-glucose 4-epimerase